MGLATAQARFLGITARKLSCEYKSTELAQQKLEITNKLSGISADYSNALNSTKLVWQNEATNKEFGVSYSLLMTPSAANDYNPYLLTSPSGAIILNSEYASAAKAAGISMAGGAGSQASRDKFIAALVPNGLITQETSVAITKTDYTGKKNDDGTVSLAEIPPTSVDASGPTKNPDSVTWNPLAGMGAKPLDKESISAMQLPDLIQSESIGQKPIDWTSMFISGDKISETEYNAELEKLNKKLERALREDLDKPVREDVSKEAQDQYTATIEQYNKDIEQAKKDGDTSLLNTKLIEKERYVNENPVKAAMSDLKNFKDNYATKQEKFESISNKFQTERNEIKDTTFEQNADGHYQIKDGLTVVNNGIINKYPNEIKEMTIGDLLTSDIVIMVQNGDKELSKKVVSESASKMLDYIAKILGHGQPGIGLNVDEASAKALEYALMMTSKIVLNPGNTVVNGSRHSDTSMTENSAYLNAESSNRIAQSGDYTAVNLSNVLASFLTYYDNYLNGTNSNYVVGQTEDTSIYVTDDTSYYYVGKESGDIISQAEKIADFFDEIYNNICEHGWREDAGIDDEEYLASVIKDGRYSMSSLNQDGYYYNTRYNETGYLVEVTDNDAIARAEAEYTKMKAELTYKEDSMDVKAKKLDAEISALSAEYDTVKGIIAKQVEKAFTMFQS